jgi:hypothetical protein
MKFDEIYYMMKYIEIYLMTTTQVSFLLIERERERKREREREEREKEF